MRPRHDKTDILQAAIDTAATDGLSQLTFGRVAKRMGINDRVVVYYFPSKDDLIGEVLVSLGAELQQTLGPALGRAVADHVELLRAAWPVLAVESADPVFALFFEAGGLAAAGREPYRTLVPRLVEGWVDWAASHIEGDPEHRSAEAVAAIAVIDGLLLMRQLAGAAAAETAAGRILRHV